MPRIARVRSHVLEAPLSEPFAWSFTETAVRGSCVVEVTTEDGLSGWGECIGPARLNAALVAAYAPLLIGQDAMQRAALGRRCARAIVGNTGAKCAVDMALADLVGQHLGVAVADLFGRQDCVGVGGGGGHFLSLKGDCL
jgi:D-galactarolactone cycloisomerase